jgi:prepilin-type N-terminal cleavage/methylation domain-containing protein
MLFWHYAASLMNRVGSMQRSLNHKPNRGFRIIRVNGGFTLVEIVVVLAILAVLASMALFAYNSYIEKAKVTVATSTLDNVRKTLEVYHIDNGNYPANIDFAGCVDNQGRTVFPPVLCDQLKSDLFAVDSYVVSGQNYLLTVRANDSSHTVMKMTADNIAIQGH